MKKIDLFQRFYDQRGSFLLEPLIAATLFATFLVFFLGSFRNIFSTQDVIWQRTRASVLAQESVESSYNWLVNNDWESAYDSVAVDKQYSIVPGDAPVEVTVPEQIDSTYSRVLQFTPVFRDSSTHQRVTSLGAASYIDEQIVEVTSTVLWKYRGKVIEVEYRTLVSNPRVEAGI
jgi:hypothetical protein